MQEAKGGDAALASYLGSGAKKWVILNEGAKDEPEVKDPEPITIGDLPRN